MLNLSCGSVNASETHPKRVQAAQFAEGIHPPALFLSRSSGCWARSASLLRHTRRQHVCVLERVCVKEKRGWGGRGTKFFYVLFRLILLKLMLVEEKERRGVPACLSANTKSCFFGDFV